MTTWLKKLRLYLLRRQLKSITRKFWRGVIEPHTWILYTDRKADLIDRISEIEKTL